MKRIFALKLGLAVLAFVGIAAYSQTLPNDHLMGDSEAQAFASKLDSSNCAATRDTARRLVGLVTTGKDLNAATRNDALSALSQVPYDGGTAAYFFDTVNTLSIAANCTDTTTADRKQFIAAERTLLDWFESWLSSAPQHEAASQGGW